VYKNLNTILTKGKHVHNDTSFTLMKFDKAQIKKSCNSDDNSFFKKLIKLHTPCPTIVMSYFVI